MTRQIKRRKIFEFYDDIKAARQYFDIGDNACFCFNWTLPTKDYKLPDYCYRCKIKKNQIFRICRAACSVKDFPLPAPYERVKRDKNRTIKRRWQSKLKREKNLARIIKKAREAVKLLAENDFSDQAITIVDSPIARTPSEIIRSGIHMPLSKKESGSENLKKNHRVESTQFTVTFLKNSKLLNMYDSDIYNALLYLVYRKRNNKIITSPKEIYRVFGFNPTTSMIKSLRKSLDRQISARIVIQWRDKSGCTRYHYEGGLMSIRAWEDIQNELRINSQIKITIPPEFVDVQTHFTYLDLRERRPLSPVSKKMYDFLKSQGIETRNKSLRYELRKFSEKVLFLELGQPLYRLKQIVNKSMMEVANIVNIINRNESKVIKSDSKNYMVNIVGMKKSKKCMKPQKALYPELSKQIKTQFKQITKNSDYKFSPEDGSKINISAKRIVSFLDKVRGEKYLQELYGLSDQDLKYAENFVPILFDAINNYLQRKAKREKSEMQLKTGHLCSNNTFRKVLPRYLRRKQKNTA